MGRDGVGDTGIEMTIVWYNYSLKRDANKIALATAERYGSSKSVNLGGAYQICVKNLLEHNTHMTGFVGMIVWDTSKPNGQPRRKLDVSQAYEQFGFEASTRFEARLLGMIE
jgi:GDP-L-fucose synthase